jgi:hypothetical protein
LQDVPPGEQIELLLERGNYRDGLDTITQAAAAAAAIVCLQDAPPEEQIELPLDGDDYGDELESYMSSMYSEDEPGRGSRKRRGSR